MQRKLQTPNFLSKDTERINGENIAYLTNGPGKTGYTSTEE